MNSNKVEFKKKEKVETFIGMLISINKNAFVDMMSKAKEDVKKDITVIIDEDVYSMSLEEFSERMTRNIR